MEADVLPRLEQFRSYLHVLTRVQLAGRPARVEASDVVQMALLQAVRAAGQFRGSTDAELAAWLRQILIRTLLNALRDQRRDCRDAGRELSLEQSIEASSARLEGWLADPASSPSERADRNEQVLRLAAALEDLAQSQREAVIRHHLQGRPLDDVAQELGRSPSAVAGLLKRGLKFLRQRLPPGD